MNKISKNDRLTPYQVFILIAVPGFSSLNALALGQLTGMVSTSHWLSILLSGLLAALMVTVVITLARKFPNDSVFTYSKKILGSFLGNIINLFYILYSIILTSFLLRVTITIIYNTGVRETPRILFIIMYLLVAAYISTKKVTVIGRVAELAFIMIMLFMIVSVLLKLEINLDFLLPFEYVGLGENLKAVLLIQNIFLGIYCLLLFFPSIESKKKSLRNSLTGVCFTTLIMAFFYIVVIGFFGPKRAGMFYWPLLKYLGTVSTPVFERMDVIIMWLQPSFDLILIFIVFYIAKTGLLETFNLKGKKNNYLLMIAIMIIIGLLTNYPKNIYDLLFYNNLIAILGITANLIIPLILYLISLLKKREIS